MDYDNKNLSDIGLDDYSLACLSVENIKTVEDLFQFVRGNPRKLLKIKGIGKVSYKSILDKLADKKLDQAERRYQKQLERKSKHQKRWEVKLNKLMIDEGITGFVTQHKFATDRKYTFDFAFPDIRFAVELDGGIFLRKGGHSTGKAIEDDRYKDQCAFLNDWIVFRVIPKMVEDGSAIRTIKHIVGRFDKKPLD